MTTPVLLALTGSAFESSVVVALQQPERQGVHIVRRCVDVADLVASAATGRARAALIAADLPHLDADVVARLRALQVEPVGVVADGESSTAVHRLHQMGIAAVLPAQGSDDLATQVVESLARSGEPMRDDTADESVAAVAPQTLGQVVAVWGPAGAPGRSTVAVGLAAELADLGASTLLVDADVYGGSVAQQLAMLDDASGLLAAARSAKVGSLEPSVLAAHCRQVGPMRVLSGLPRPDRWPELSPVALSSVLATARTLAAHVVVDCGFSLETEEELMFDTAAPRRNGATLCVLEQADRVLTVGSADPVGLSRLARGIVDLADTVPGCEPEIVVNRMRGSLGWSPEEATSMLERFTGRRHATVLPDDRTSCDRALVHGQTLVECAPGSPLRTGLREIASEVCGVPVPRRGRRRRVRGVS